MTSAQQLKRKRYALNRKYGLTIDQYAALLSSQGGKCAICRVDTPGGMGSENTVHGWHVDHSRMTGQVRGLLCARCNMGVGYFSDDSEVLVAAAQYMMKFEDVLSSVDCVYTDRPRPCSRRRDGAVCTRPDGHDGSHSSNEGPGRVIAWP